MPQSKDPSSYPPEISRILNYVYESGKEVTLPCATKSKAISLRLRFGGYIAALRNNADPRWEKYGALVVRENSKAIERGDIPESEACVTIQFRSLETETTIPADLMQAIEDFELEEGLDPKGQLPGVVRESEAEEGSHSERALLDLYGKKE